MLPEKPSFADFKKEAREIAQLAKEVQNVRHCWSDEEWRKISRIIERLEEK